MDLHKKVEDLIDLALDYVNNVNESLAQLNNTMDKLSSIEDIKEICSSEDYQIKLKELESKMCEMLTSIEGEES